MYQLIILAGIVVVALLMVYAGNRLNKPFEVLARIGIQIAIGAVLIILFNIVFTPFDFKLALNPITAIIAGNLGVPGFAALIIIKLLVA